MNDPANDPLVLWLNGGPGCSSLIGFWLEQGPFRFDRLTGNISVNDYAWNKVANVIFLESPAGVRYSYSDSENYSTDDDQTSLDNLNAVKAFLEKFPQYRENDFFVTGESYAGIYVPTLSVRLLNEPEINFKGFAIGNGYFDESLGLDSKLFFGYFHDLIPAKEWKSWTQACNCSAARPCGVVEKIKSNPNCEEAFQQLISSLDDVRFRFNPYDIYGQCDPKESTVMSSESSFQFDPMYLFKRVARGEKPHPHSVDLEPCLKYQNLIDYMNDADVRDALNIPDSVQEWLECNMNVNTDYNRTYITVKPQILQLLNAGKYGMIYNGDTDFVCDFLMARWFVDDLNLKTVSDSRPWIDDEDQLAGSVQDFKNLSLVTVRGAGHLVPESKPYASLKLFKAFLNNEPLK